MHPDNLPTWDVSKTAWLALVIAIPAAVEASAAVLSVMVEAAAPAAVGEAPAASTLETWL